MHTNLIRHSAYRVPAIAKEVKPRPAPSRHALPDLSTRPMKQIPIETKFGWGGREAGLFLGSREGGQKEVFMSKTLENMGQGRGQKTKARKGKGQRKMMIK